MVKLFIDEEGSELAAHLWDHATILLASRLAYPEVRAALSSARRASRLGEAEERDAAGLWQEFWTGIKVVELTEVIATEAAELASRHALGGADAVHLASALTMAAADPVVVAWDLRLRAAAMRAGLRVAPA